MLERALDAVRELGARLDLPDAEPEILKDGANLLVKLGSVVAKVATTTALVRPGVAAWLERDVTLARFAGARGVPVVRPCDEPPPGPHHQDGFAATFWRYTPHEQGRRPESARTGELLGVLHEALAGYRGALPEDGPAREIDDVLSLLDATDLPAELLGALRDRAPDTVAAAATATADWPVQALHGDAHPGNLLITPDGPVWIDFEDAWRGPIAWDLAVLTRASPHEGVDALAAYPGSPSPQDLAPFVRLRELHALCWHLVLARRFPDRRAPARTAADAYLAGTG
ncbi:hypothetical protein CFN78_06065 [Amycolatopsis antarctica]|uniref:Aminoglycoside phosphotransferase domain-containing protein n=1 Tax=Amycolatopsis antarctica TaxID=1854586 RepID=A0A263D902_9PSEU|nr:phosphotransferase [Amycolatopsis antarctica]OZM73865.1 hypothetical protein CFN78_06065 [Amycolatopsis antarctica]